LGFYQSALRLAKAADNKYSQDQWTPKAHAVWKELGGTTEGWQHWQEQLAPLAGSKNLGDRWSKMERPLPTFEVSDLAGKTWKKTSLAGKTAFVNLWATWCGPCREELPHLQKLYDRVKDREDVLLITFNVDDNLGAVEPFMKENKYTFPVLLAKDVIDAYLGAWSIPRNWLADRNGILRFEVIGFGNEESEAWIQKMIDQIEVVRGGAD
jgi:thiol-disulfide isomerase/thioredoxin